VTLLFPIPALELAYMAGLVDGEGCISVDHRSNVAGKQKTIHLRLSVYNTKNSSHAPSLT
jgi:peptide deformylase